MSAAQAEAPVEEGASSMVPSACSCGETKNFYFLNGLHFCGVCGRKLSKTGASKPPKKPEQTPRRIEKENEPQNEASSASAKIASVRARMSRKPSRPRARPAPPATEPRPSRPRLSHASPPTSPMAKNPRQRLFLDRAAEKESKKRLQNILVRLKADKEAVSNEDILKLEAALTVMNETDLIEIELEQTREHAETLKQDNRQLKATLEEVMTSYQKVVEEAKGSKSDSVATIGILEEELERTRNLLTRTQKGYKKLQEDHIVASTKWKDIDKSEKDLKAKYEQSENERKKLQKQFEVLKEHAGNKLKDAAAQYLSVQRADSEKDALVVQYQHEIKNLRHRCKMSESRVDEVSVTLQQTEKKVRQVQEILERKTAECAKLTASFNAANGMLAQTTQQFEETEAISKRYKDQLVKAREVIRSYNAQLKSAEQSENELNQLRIQLDNEQADMRRLKSKLFDCAELEQSLKQQLAAHKNPTGTRIVEVERELEDKERQNKELIRLCDELLAEVEQFKAKEASGS